MMRLEGIAPAKINLTLEVLGRRPDGYHAIASVMHTLSLHDTLILELPDAPVLEAGRGEIAITDSLASNPSDRFVGVPADETHPKRSVSVPADETHPQRSVGVPADETHPQHSVGVPADETHPQRSVGVPADERAHIPTDSRNLVWKAVALFVESSPTSLSHSVGKVELCSPSPFTERGLEGEVQPRETIELAVGGWRAILIKHIPTQAGLGGGSSNAATTLKLLARWAQRMGLPTPNLHGIAAQLGADVAFFVGEDADATQNALVGGDANATKSALVGEDADATEGVFVGEDANATQNALVGEDADATENPLVGGDANATTNRCALVTGKGEILTPLPPLPRLWWVIAKPYCVSVPTGWAYEQLQRGEIKPHISAPHTERLTNALRQGAIRTPIDLAPLLHNDFDVPILKAFPELRTLRLQMEQAGALKVILCGSGAAQVGLCETQKHAENIANTLIQQGYWAVAVHTP